MINNLVFFLSILFLSGCCSVNTSFNVQPTSCQCKKLNKLVSSSIKSPEADDIYYSLIDISVIELREVILQNSDCWIGKSYDYVRKVLPPPIENKFGGDPYYAAAEDINCRSMDCKILRFHLNDHLNNEKNITNIEASRGDGNNDWIIRLHTPKR